MKTHLCDVLDIKVPILQAAIGGISCPALAAAVSNAGGLGSIALTRWGRDGSSRKLRETRELTPRGIAANVLLSYDIRGEFEAMLESPPLVASFFWGDIDPYVKPVHDVGSLVMGTVGSVDEAMTINIYLYK